MTRLLALLLIACASDPCSPTHPDMAALLAECKLRVMRECPNLKRDECAPNQPCPQCPAIEQCDGEVRKACGSPS